MGEAELDMSKKILLIRSHIITYGNAADEMLTRQMTEEIESMWNEPAAAIRFQNENVLIRFIITAGMLPELTELEVIQNLDPRNNYFRIEEYAHGNISFVDGLGCNSGYFKLENLYKGSTTSAHEYGHTLGLNHPTDLDLRGKGVPGIMYPRGTLTDPEFQYDPAIPAGQKGGTMHPMYRKVLAADIIGLKLNQLAFKHSKAIVGDFTNIYHGNHGEALT